jgi:prepilin-type N-terminal cleavage/methylation domain-containing protein
MSEKMHAADEGRHPLPRRSGVRPAFRTPARRGMSLPELLVSLTLMAFVIVSCATLLTIGRRQQRTWQQYSQIQTDLRMALRRASRTIRHGSVVLNPSVAANFPVKTSSATQLIVLVPEPTGTTPTTVEVRFHLNGGVLYAQRSDVSGNGIALMSGVQSVAFSYYRTVAGARTSVPGAPHTATEVGITLTGSSGALTTNLTALVAMRNALLSL